MFGGEEGKGRKKTAGAGLPLFMLATTLRPLAVRKPALSCARPPKRRHLVRNGCPDASRIEYGGGMAECWQGRTFVAPKDSPLLARPCIGMPDEVYRAGRQWWAKGRPVAAPGPEPAVTWQQQPHSGLLGMPGDLLDRVVGAAGEQEGLVLLAALGRCCQQLRAYASVRLPPPRPDPSQAECRRPAPFISWSGLKEGQQALKWQLPGAPFCAAPNWRAAAAALPAALEQRRARSANLQNALRIAGLVRGMIEELLQPLTPEEQAALGAEAEEERAMQAAARAAQEEAARAMRAAAGAAARDGS